MNTGSKTLEVAFFAGLVGFADFFSPSSATQNAFGGFRVRDGRSEIAASGVAAFVDVTLVSRADGGSAASVVLHFLRCADVSSSSISPCSRFGLCLGVHARTD